MNTSSDPVLRGGGAAQLSFARCASADRLPPECDRADSLFVLVSHDVGAVEARALLDAIPAPPGDAGLFLSQRRRELVVGVLADFTGRFVVTVSRQRSVLAELFYEAVFEPLLMGKDAFFERVDLTRYVVGIVERNLEENGLAVKAIGEQLDAFLYTFDPADAPTFFDEGYRREIVIAPIAGIVRGRRAELLRTRRERGALAPVAELVQRRQVALAVRHHVEHWSRYVHPIWMGRFDDVTEKMLLAEDPGLLRGIDAATSRTTAASAAGDLDDASIGLAELMAVAGMAAFGIADPPFAPQDGTYRGFRNFMGGSVNCNPYVGAQHPYPDPDHAWVEESGRMLEALSRRADDAGPIWAGIVEAYDEMQARRSHRRRNDFEADRQRQQ